MRDDLTLRTKFLRFAASGVATTILHVIVATATVYWLDFDAMQANVSAFLVANSVSYLLNAIWSFEAGVSAVNYGRFIIVSAICLGATIAISAVSDNLGYPPYYSIAVIMVFIPTLAFAVHYSWTFH